MQTLIIPIHSFVDVITNSSTEIYVNSTQGTVKALKELVDNILKSANSDKSCDDLFEIKLISTNDETDSGDLSPNNKLSVVPLKDTRYQKEAAKTLGSLSSIFNIEASYNG